MSSLKTPSQKRRAALRRDHRTEMEIPHAFRKNWPKKKARVNRDRRRVARAAVAEVLRGVEEAEALVVPRRLRGEHLDKMGVGTLGEVVARKSRRVRTDFLPQYVRPRGDPTKHAHEFRGFLAALVRGRSRISLDRAAHLLWLLDANLRNNHSKLYQQVWLRSFFLSEPHWEAHVRRWASSVRKSHSGGAVEQPGAPDKVRAVNRSGPCR